jgi:hypothetical protein
LRGEVDRAAIFLLEHDYYGNRRQFPPIEVVRDILANSSSLGFPIARGILRYPILPPEGTTRTEAGLDERTGWIYDPFPSDFSLPAIPVRPTRRDLRGALAEVHEVIGESRLTEMRPTPAL